MCHAPAGPTAKGLQKLQNQKQLNSVALNRICMVSVHKFTLHICMPLMALASSQHHDYPELMT